jgi:hypothetical protein
LNIVGLSYGKTANRASGIKHFGNSLSLVATSAMAQG